MLYRRLAVGLRDDRKPAEALISEHKRGCGLVGIKRHTAGEEKSRLSGDLSPSGCRLAAAPAHLAAHSNEYPLAKRRLSGTLIFAAWKTVFRRAATDNVR